MRAIRSASRGDAVNEVAPPGAVARACAAPLHDDVDRDTGQTAVTAG